MGFDSSGGGGGGGGGGLTVVKEGTGYLDPGDPQRHYFDDLTDFSRFFIPVVSPDPDGNFSPNGDPGFAHDSDPTNAVGYYMTASASRGSWWLTVENQDSNYQYYKFQVLEP